MINAIEVENFKSIGTRRRIEVRPITLLFGANSSGKSTLIQALQYAREVFCRQNCDPDRTAIGGEHIRLGGFRTFVHKRELDRPIRFRFDLDLSDRTLVSPGVRTGETEDGVYLYSDSSATPRLPNQVTSASVEIEIAWSNIHSIPYVRQYRTSINGKWFATIKTLPERQWASSFTGLNVNHPIFAREGEERGFLEELLPENSYTLALRADDEEKLTREFEIREGIIMGIPVFTRGLAFHLGPHVAITASGISDIVPGSEAFLGVVNKLVVSPGELVADWLEKLVYLGPLRELPSREYTPTQHRDRSRWSSGLAAWDELYETELDVQGRTGTDLTEAVSAWLDEKDRLGLGYRVIVRQFRELADSSDLGMAIRSGRLIDDFDADDLIRAYKKLPLRRRLAIIDDTGFELAPTDVGVGISQVIPVVTLAMCHPDVAAIEQPELHLHPAAQVGLGDLFIESIQNGKHDDEKSSQRLFIETHSEHLLLRLLRRVRETHQGELPIHHPGLRPDELSVVYVEPADHEDDARHDEDEGAQIYQLRVDETGEFRDRWPKGFFEERGKELFGP